MLPTADKAKATDLSDAFGVSSTPVVHEADPMEEALPNLILSPISAESKAQGELIAKGLTLREPLVTAMLEVDGTKEKSTPVLKLYKAIIPCAKAKRQILLDRRAAGIAIPRRWSANYRLWVPTSGNAEQDLENVREVASQLTTLRTAFQVTDLWFDISVSSRPMGNNLNQDALADATANMNIVGDETSDTSL